MYTDDVEDYNREMMWVKADAAVQLRIKGWPWFEIAEEAGFESPAQARYYVEQALKRHESPNVQTLREMTDLRLTALFKASYKMAELGDDKAIANCLRILEQYRKLHGLDAPQRVAVSVSPTEDEDVEQLRREWVAMKEGQRRALEA